MVCFFSFIIICKLELIHTYLFFLFSNDESSIRNDSFISAPLRESIDCDIGGHIKPLDLESPQCQSDYSELLCMTSSSEMYGIKKYRLSILL